MVIKILSLGFDEPDLRRICVIRYNIKSEPFFHVNVGACWMCMEFLITTLFHYVQKNTNKSNRVLRKNHASRFGEKNYSNKMTNI